MLFNRLYCRVRFYNDMYTSLNHTRISHGEGVMQFLLDLFQQKRRIYKLFVLRYSYHDNFM